MSDDLFANIEEFTQTGQSSPQAPARKATHRKASPAAAQAAAKKRSKPSVDRYRSQGMPQMPNNAYAQQDMAYADAAPARSKKKKKNKKNTMSAEAMMKSREEKAQKQKSAGNIIQRIIFFFRTRSLTELWYTFLDWVSRHVYVTLLVAVIFIVFGMMISRYISVTGALMFIILGALLSKEDYDTAGYFCYGAALMDFMIPYVF